MFDLVKKYWLNQINSYEGIGLLMSEKRNFRDQDFHQQILINAWFEPLGLVLLVGFFAFRESDIGVLALGELSESLLSKSFRRACFGRGFRDPAFRKLVFVKLSQSF